ncbi:MAG: hypothetical protein DWQ42_07890 [Planctomycetota bacterium]|nr:MAG: hypothetical protein DWQ42_07890 [Planctomycetota bacterium]REK47302.1 MAG: hypothetical protein DWQ46_04720 [Planctomycetota bacterium]
MLRWRLLLGPIMAAITALLVYADFVSERPGVYLLPVMTVFAILSAGEMVRLGSGQARRPPRVGIYLGTTLVVISNFVPHLVPELSGGGSSGAMAWPLATLAVAILFVSLVEILNFENAEKVSANLCFGVFAIAYVAGLGSFIAQLRYLDSSRWGTLAVISLFFIVKMSDIGAYIVGRLLGRHKLAPRVSPGKTIEGLVGGLAFAAVSAWVTFAVVGPQWLGTPTTSPWWKIMSYGVLLALVGVLGDLNVSLLKRAANLKDSSVWLPGFGGVLDLIDSLLAAAPVAYLLLAFEWIVPAGSAS